MKMEYSSYMPSQKEFNLYSYFNDSILRPRQFYHTGFENTLEKIVLNETPESGKDFLERAIDDKNHTLKATIKALFNEIMLRERLDSFLLYKINDEICKTKTYLEEIRFLVQRQYNHDLMLELNSRRTQLETRVIELEKEKRQEYRECWRDLMFLKKYLLSALKDYWELSRRVKHLGYEQFMPEKNSEFENVE